MRGVKTISVQDIRASPISEKIAEWSRPGLCRWSVMRLVKDCDVIDVSRDVSQAM